MRVVVLGPEAVDHGTVELWLAHRRLGVTLLSDGEIVLQIDAPPPDSPHRVGAHSLAAALEEAAVALRPVLSRRH